MDDRRTDLGFRELDPERSEPGYWAIFQLRTTALAEPELERRRARAGTTVPGVLTSWSRTVVPLATAAAAVAIMMIVAEEGTSEPEPEPAVATAEAVAAPESSATGIERTETASGGADRGTGALSPESEEEPPAPFLDGAPGPGVTEVGSVPVVLTASVEGF